MYICSKYIRYLCLNNGVNINQYLYNILINIFKTNDIWYQWIIGSLSFPILEKIQYLFIIYTSSNVNTMLQIRYPSIRLQILNKKWLLIFIKIIFILFYGILFPVIEEIIFRQIIHTYLFNTFYVSPILCIVISSCIFSVIHLTNIILFYIEGDDDIKSSINYQLRNTLILGIGCGILFESIGIISCITLHSIHNIFFILNL